MGWYPPFWKNIFRLTNLINPRVVALLVTSKIVPMQFTETIGTEGVSADEVTPAFLADLLHQANSKLVVEKP